MSTPLTSACLTAHTTVTPKGASALPTPEKTVETSGSTSKKVNRAFYENVHAPLIDSGGNISGVLQLVPYTAHRPQWRAHSSLELFLSSTGISREALASMATSAAAPALPEAAASSSSLTAPETGIASASGGGRRDPKPQASVHVHHVLLKLQTRATILSTREPSSIVSRDGSLQTVIEQSDESDEDESICPSMRALPIERAEADEAEGKDVHESFIKAISIQSFNRRSRTQSFHTYEEGAAEASSFSAPEEAVSAETAAQSFAALTEAFSDAAAFTISQARVVSRRSRSYSFYEPEEEAEALKVLPPIHARLTQERSVSPGASSTIVAIEGVSVRPPSLAFSDLSRIERRSAPASHRYERSTLPLLASRVSSDSSALETSRASLTTTSGIGFRTLHQTITGSEIRTVASPDSVASSLSPVSITYEKSLRRFVVEAVSSRIARDSATSSSHLRLLPRETTASRKARESTIGKRFSEIRSTTESLTPSSVTSFYERSAVALDRSDLSLSTPSRIHRFASFEWASLTRIKCLREKAQTIIWQVMDRETERHYALKRMEFKSGILSSYRKDLAYNEIGFGTRLRHPALLRVFGSRRTKTTHDILMELGPTNTLATYTGRLSSAQIRFIAAQLVHVIAYLEKHHILHCNLSLSNILIDRKCRIKVIGMGAAVEMKDSTFVTCCPTYDGSLSPEHKRDGKIALSTQWWLLGTMLFQLERGSLSTPAASASTRSTDLPIREPVLWDLICKLTEKYTDRRPSLEAIIRHSYFKNIAWHDLFTGSPG